MGGYVGKLQIGNNSSNQIAFGDLLCGECTTGATDAAKQITAVQFPTFDRCIDGIQIRVKFVNGNSVTSNATLQIGSTNTYSIEGNFVCAQGDIITFTWVEGSPSSCWRVTGGGINSTIQEYINTATASASAAADCMVFKGTLGSGGTQTTVPTPAAEYKKGWTYKVVTAGTYAGNTCEVGDLFIAINDAPATGSSVINADWTVVQSNLDSGLFKGSNSLTDTHVLIADGTNGQVRDSGFTIATSVPANAVFTDTISTISAGDNTGSIPLVETNQGVLIIHGIQVTTSSAST